jgi:hypothetical protein
MFTGEQTERMRNWGLLLALVAVTIVIRLPILAEPWGGDQAGFGYMAKGILAGEVPYKDIYSLTGPGVFFTFALFFKLFGMNMAAAHIGHMLASVVTVLLVYVVTCRLYGRTAAVVAGVCYTVFSNGLAFSGFGYENKSAWGTYWYLSQREVFMAPLMAGAVLLAMSVRDKRGMAAGLSYFCMGVLTGLAAFYKLTAVLMALALAGFLAFGDLARADFFRGPGLRRRAVCLRAVGCRLFMLLAGFVLIQLPFAYYFWSHDALRDVYQALFVHVALYAGLSRGLLIETLFSGHYSMLRENLVLWLFAATSALHMLVRDGSRNSQLIVVWAVSSLLMVWGQGKFFGYHFILLIPPFSVLAGYGIPRFLGPVESVWAFLRQNVNDIQRNFMLVTLGLSVVGFGMLNYDYYRRHVVYFLGKMPRQEYYRVFNEFPTHPYSFRTDYEIANAVQDRLREGDRFGVIFSAGDTVIHFLLGMEDVTRFLQSWYLFPSDELLANHAITRDLRREFVEEVVRVAPRFLLCVHIPLEELVSLPTLKADPSVQKLWTFVQENYEIRREFPDNRFLFERL